MRLKYDSRNIFFGVLAIAATGCIGQNNLGSLATTNNTNTATTSTTTAIPGGPKGVTFLFKQTSAGGSFASAPSNGTAPGTATTSASGLQATQVFLPDKITILESNGPSGANWPKWISSLDIGVSGSSNTSATNPDCARFSLSGTGDTATCKYTGTGGGNPTNCGAPADYFRVSDIDCYNANWAGANTNPTSPTNTNPRGVGSGDQTDGVFVRVAFNRNSAYLGTTENIMVVIEYAASGYSPSPTTPAAVSNCFAGGSAKIRNCADSTWQAFLKDSATTPAQPFFLLTPPFFGYVNPSAGPANTGTGGSAVSTRQFILPLAASPTTTIFQLSRTGMSTVLAPQVATPTPDATFLTTCAPNGYSANSAFCLGMVFYSISFYRI